jgi:hypothetical protein
LIPDRDPGIADRDDHTPDRLPATQPLPGTDLEPRRAQLPELAQPHRAGSIVAEFVNSIVEEAQERAIQMIQAAADQNDAGQREALESADRMRAHIDEMAEELETAAGQLRSESERLASLRRLTTAATVTGGAAVGEDEGEQLALAQVSAGLAQHPGETAQAPEADHDEHDEGPHDVEVVHHGDEDEGEEHHEPVDATEEPVAAEPEVKEPIATEPQPEPDPEPEPDPDPEATRAEDEPLGQEETVVDEPEPAAEAQPDGAGLHAMSVAGRQAETEAPAEPDVEEQELEAEPPDEERELEEDHARCAAMADADLALAYTGAIARLEDEPEGERSARLLRYAGAALGEALTRASFADLGQGAPAPDPIPRFGRRRKERAEAMNALRRACAQAIEEIDADDPDVGSAPA